MSLAALVPIALDTSIFLTVLGLGLRTSVGDATSLVREPSRLARSLVAMMVVMPATAVLLARSFDLHPAVKIALVALSVSPVPPLWPKRTLKAGGDESFTLGLLVATAAMAIVIIPVAMEAFQRVFSIQLRMPPDAVARLALMTVLLPLGLGLVVRRLTPGFAAGVAKPIGFLATLLLTASVLAIVLKLGPAAMSLIGDGTLVAMTAFALVALAAGHLLGGPAREDRLVLALASASRHPAIAIAIAELNFPGETLVAPAVVLHLLVSAVVTTPYVRSRLPEGRRPKAAIAAR